AGNTFTGTTTVQSGFLHLNKTAGTALNGPLVINSGREADLLHSNQILDTAAVTVNGGGTLSLSAFSDTIGALTVAGGSVTTGTGMLTVNGLVTLTAGSINGSLTLNNNIVSNAAAVSATISANLDLGAATRTVTVADGAAADDLVISG